MASTNPPAYDQHGTVEGICPEHYVPAYTCASAQCETTLRALKALRDKALHVDHDNEPDYADPSNPRYWGI